MEIRKAKKEDFEACTVIAKGLPEWFEQNEISEITNDITTLPTFVIDDGEIQAFAVMEDKYAETVEIKHFAVAKNHHRSGMGTILLKYIEKEYSDKTYIEVKTLDASADYEPYVGTRSFYEKNGFVKVEVINPYPGWSPGNPCAVYKKSI
jgi:N-acetylglutamate synthase-like GNAT family acetyltransferase